MADADPEPSDKNVSSPPRRPYYQNQNRANSSYRGRGRANASVSKALHFFGVRDLREILDRRHQEQTRSGPPPDPSYNYLKDPLRENTNEHQTQRHSKEHHYPDRAAGDTHQRGHTDKGPRGRGRGGWSPRDNRHSELEKPTFLHNPINIKVEVVASTGERNCQFDEETKIADIKHVPNYQSKDLRTARIEGGRGRGTERPDRGRGREDRGGGGRGFGDRGRGGRGFGDRGGGRGFWDRGGRGFADRGGGRGRGDRGGGRTRGNRGRGRGGSDGERGQERYYSPRNNENNPPNQIPEVPTEENWDTECSNPPQNVEIRREREGGEHYDHEYTENQEEHDGTDLEPYYEGGSEEEYAETNEQNQSFEEGSSDSNINVEENLVITSSHDDEKRKRTVQFKLEDKEKDQSANEDGKNEKEPLGEEEIEKKEKTNEGN